MIIDGNAKFENVSFLLENIKEKSHGQKKYN